MWTLVGLLVLGICVTIQAQTTPMSVEHIKAELKQSVDGLFQIADKNHDGHLDDSDMAAIFSDYDTAGTGKITKAQFISKFTAHTPGLTMVAQGLFVDLDTNKDGVITTGDMNSYKKRLDKDNDGFVSEQEFDEYFVDVFVLLLVLQGAHPSGI